VVGVRIDTPRGLSRPYSNSTASQSSGILVSAAPLPYHRPLGFQRSISRPQPVAHPLPGMAAVHASYHTSAKMNVLLRDRKVLLLRDLGPDHGRIKHSDTFAHNLPGRVARTEVNTLTAGKTCRSGCCKMELCSGLLSRFEFRRIFRGMVWRNRLEIRSVQRPLWCCWKRRMLV
jgi:hypothetical protein